MNFMIAYLEHLMLYAVCTGTVKRQLAWCQLTRHDGTQKLDRLRQHSPAFSMRLKLHDNAGRDTN